MLFVDIVFYQSKRKWTKIIFGSGGAQESPWIWWEKNYLSQSSFSASAHIHLPSWQLSNTLCSSWLSLRLVIRSLPAHDTQLHSPASWMKSSGPLNSCLLPELLMQPLRNLWRLSLASVCALILDSTTSLLTSLADVLLSLMAVGLSSH